MIFEKEKYYNLINGLEKMVTATYAIIMIIAILIGASIGKKALIIAILIGLLFSYIYTFNAKVRIQEMKWKFDIYNKLG